MVDRNPGTVLAHVDPALRKQMVAVDLNVKLGQSVADVARDVLDRHPGSHIVVARSFGGMLAQEVALIGSSHVCGLALISTIPGATQRVAGINRALADDIEAIGLQNVADGVAAGLFAPGRLANNPELGAAFVADLLDAGATSVCTALRAIADWDASDRLPALRCPATVITGDAEPDKIGNHCSLG